MNMLKNTAKKIYKTGLYTDICLSDKSLTYKDVFSNIYSLQNVGFNRFIFRIGHAEKFTYSDYTFKSDYSVFEEQTGYIFIEHYKPTITDNPDFILRASLSNLHITKRS